MKKISHVLLFILSINSFSQKNKSTKFDTVSLEELKMTTYAKDTTANAVVLYEDKEYKTTTDFYFKVKILSKEGADKATITIPNIWRSRNTFY